MLRYCRRGAGVREGQREVLCKYYDFSSILPVGCSHQSWLHVTTLPSLLVYHYILVSSFLSVVVQFLSLFFPFLTDISEILISNELKYESLFLSYVADWHQPLPARQLSAPQAHSGIQAPTLLYLCMAKAESLLGQPSTEERAQQPQPQFRQVEQKWQMFILLTFHW